ncbi:hypothetical protein [Micromonospora polyrhachis]|uniref:Uncharacterized protein n=1 Tax=Micromonospora polyrhachis TaxID=1282883 RepID=A0A7W7SY49_9ACTN|nr:hypothetical protein [Micromonospora polyrhachis]MBB4961785.1 hypothetical protein [Micromonospora polyrhachis]
MRSPVYSPSSVAGRARTWRRRYSLDRDAGWLDPMLLRGERSVLNDHLTIVDDGPLPVDGPNTLFEVGDERVAGRELAGRDLNGVEWRVERIRVATDGTREDALRITTEIEDAGDIYVDKEPDDNPIGIGEIVTVWEDEHGQWDLALVRL